MKYIAAIIALAGLSTAHGQVYVDGVKYSDSNAAMRAIEQDFARQRADAERMSLYEQSKISKKRNSATSTQAKRAEDKADLALKKIDSLENNKRQVELDRRAKIKWDAEYAMRRQGEAMAMAASTHERKEAEMRVRARREAARQAAIIRNQEMKQAPKTEKEAMHLLQRTLSDGRVKVILGNESETFLNQKEASAWIKAQQQKSSTPPPASSTISSRPETSGEILEAIGASFAKQVDGTIEKGGRSYLQLQSGGLLKSGTSFPALIPEFKGQTFTVTVSDITSRGYTLKTGESSLPVLFNP